MKRVIQSESGFIHLGLIIVIIVILISAITFFILKSSIKINPGIVNIPNKIATPAPTKNPDNPFEETAEYTNPF